MSTLSDRDRPFTLQRLRQLRQGGSRRLRSSTAAASSTLLLAETDDAAVLDAAGSCPMGAIAVYDQATGEQAA